MTSNELRAFILNPRGVQENIELANYYIRNEQYPPAVTHLIKAFENCKEGEYHVKYHCLMMLAWLARSMGDRSRTVSQMSKLARTEMYDRPEAYEFLCEELIKNLDARKVYEMYDWIEVFETSKIGAILQKNSPWINSIYYKGGDYLTAIYCLSMLRIGKIRELRDFLSSHRFTDTNSAVIDLVQMIYQALRLPCPYNQFDPKFDSLKDQVPFELDRINYSQSFQDLFALTIGGTRGTYLEIGASDPRFGNNTKLLEELGWTGVSIDLSPQETKDWSAVRKNKLIINDALTVNYDTICKELADKDGFIDYLQIDIDPEYNNLLVLHKIPFHKYKFRCITFEHDKYRIDDTIQLNGYEYLSNYLGYVRVAKDVTHNHTEAFEDWYVHGDDLHGIELMTDLFEGSNGVPKNIFCNQ